MSKAVSIMLIDDNQIDLFINTETLKAIPFIGPVSPYEFAGSALAYLEEQEAGLWPDIILLDIYMPGMNGFEFLKQYMNLPPEPRSACRVIMLSSSLNSDDLEKATTANGIFGFLEKPLDPEKLKQLILA